VDNPPPEISLLRDVVSVAVDDDAEVALLWLKAERLG
jgi:hypothetical protein